MSSVHRAEILPTYMYIAHVHWCTCICVVDLHVVMIDDRRDYVYSYIVYKHYSLVYIYKL